MARRLRNGRRRIHGGRFRKVQRDLLSQHTPYIVRLARFLDDEAKLGIAMLPYYPSEGSWLDAGPVISYQEREVGFRG